MHSQLLQRLNDEDTLATNPGYFLRPDNRLAYRLGNGDSLILPQSEQDALLLIQHLHTETGHYGTATTRTQVDRRLGLDPKERERLTDLVVRQYHSCQKAARVKTAIQRQQPLHHMPDFGLFDLWAIDLMGPMEKRHDCRYVISAVEYATGYAVVRALPDKKHEGVVDFIASLCNLYGVPKHILTDNGTEFMNDVVQYFCDDRGIHHMRTSPHHPETNGRVERFNKELQDRLRVLQIARNTQDWVSLLETAVFLHNTHPVRPHRKSPFELLYGTPARSTIDNDGYKLAKAPSLNEVFRFVRLRDSQLHDLSALRKQAMAARGRRYHAEYMATTRDAVQPSFRPGDVVLRLKSNRKNKLSPYWDGPWIIFDVAPGGAYQLQAMDGFVLSSLENQKNLKLASPPTQQRWQEEGNHTRRLHSSRLRPRRRPARDSQELVT